MKRRLTKPKAREGIEVVITGITVGIIGFIIASMMSARFHSKDVIEMQKKTEMSVTQISQNN